MNKTVNINLAGIFFHIDEDAFLKLQGYLDAIRQSLTDSQGRAEIIADIEARIAELFNERIVNNKRVISLKEVDDVIVIMGQPEDYVVDDSIFEDDPLENVREKTKRPDSGSRKLFRDTDNSYIAGVSSGLGHYFGIDAIWIRLLWVLLAFGSGGTFIFIYILFWILVPEAVTTSDKLNMTGDPVNISNIEKKIKDGFENVSQNVSDAVKNMDLPRQGNRIKTGSRTFFSALGELILFIFKVIGKCIGIVLMIIGAFSLIALLVALFSVGIAEIINIPGVDFLDATNAANIPIWMMSVLMFFAIAIPFFFLFYLGLKILVNNLKSIGQIAKFSLLGLWLMAIIGLVIIGVKQASEYSEDAVVQHHENLNLTANDTLYISMRQNHQFSKQFDKHGNRWKPVYDQDDQKLLYLTDIGIVLKSTKDSMASIKVEKSSKGNTYQNAKKNAEKINYNYILSGNTLELDDFLTTAFKNKYRDQEVDITLYIPEGSVIFADKNTYTYYPYGGNHMLKSSYIHNRNFDRMRNTSDDHIYDNGRIGHYLQIINDEIQCLDCPEEANMEMDMNDGTSDLQLDEDSLRLKNDTNSVEINKDGIETRTDKVEVKIDKEGIKITTDKK